MRKFLLLLVPALLGLTPQVRADTTDKFLVPAQKIEGADTPIPFGEIVVLNPSAIKTTPKYLSSISYQWKVLVNGKEKTRGIRTFDDGSVVFGGTPDQKITAILTISYLYTVRQGDKEDGVIQEVGHKQSNILTADVVIVGPGPVPNPPSPTPTPTPPGPNPNPPTPAPPQTDRFGLSDKVSGWMSTVSLAPEKKKATATALAQVFIKLADQAAQNKVKDVNDLVSQTKTEAGKVLKNGVLLAAFSTWANSLNDTLSSLAQKGQLKTLADWAEAYRGVAAGLQK